MDVANDVAKEIRDRWVWCNVYPLHYLTISKKVQALVVAFSKLDRYHKKKRGASFLEKKAEFLSDIDKLFDVFCNDNEQRRRLEKDHKLRMTDEDFVFYEDQKSRRIGKCIDVALPLTSSDQIFIRRSESHVSAPSLQCQNEIITLSTTHYVSESESLASTSTDTSQSSAVSQFLEEMPNPSI